MKKKKFKTKIIMYEFMGFGVLFFFLWADELLDLPHHLLGVPATPVNWAESTVESSAALLLCLLIVLFTVKLLNQINYLEGFFSICSFCKKIRVGERCIPLDIYLAQHSDAMLSHGCCPECAKAHYRDYIA